MFAKMLSYLSTGQRAPMKDVKTPQVPNSAGGYSWRVSPWTQLSRFLILGSSAGSYYASARKLTQENASAVVDCLSQDGLKTVETIASISESGRAPKNDPAILALAICLKVGDLSARKAAVDAVPRVCRTGTHLFHLAAAVDSLGGWGRATRRAFARWYQREDLEQLAYQVSKYRQRDGWSHRDVLRKSHPSPPSEAHNALYRWVTQGELVAGAPARLGLVDLATSSTSARDVAYLIEEHGLVREEVPTQFLNDVAVWRALLRSGRGMPMTAMLRNLAKMTSLGILSGRSSDTMFVADRLRSVDALRKARIHPLAILVALNTYRRGKGVKGSLTWTPVPELVNALEMAFDLSFGVVPRTGKRHLLAVDVSGSMGWSEIAGMTGVTPRVGAAAMAMVTHRVEPQTIVTAFSTKLIPVNLPKNASLETVQKHFDGIPMGGTDCAQPMLYALKNRIPVDTVVVYTDSETWFGKVHPAEALRRYRDQMGIHARLIVCGMVSNKFTIADPDDKGMLDVVGFDTAAPSLMARFSMGELD
jgi:60 kDa SS-A/Ro ribonucleoprotein